MLTAREMRPYDKKSSKFTSYVINAYYKPFTPLVLVSSVKIPAYTPVAIISSECLWFSHHPTTQ